MSFTTTSGMSLTIPNHYGYVILTACIGNGFILSTYLGVVVMKARTKYNVPYPNLYATPGLHKEADAFNRYQRGHQAILESLSPYIILSLIGGLQYPITVTIFNIIHIIGCILFQIGYGDTTLDVKDARYQKGGSIKWLSMFGVMYCTIIYSGKCNQWW